MLTYIMNFYENYLYFPKKKKPQWEERLFYFFCRFLWFDKSWILLSASAFLLLEYIALVKIYEESMVSNSYTAGKVCILIAFLR